MPAFVIIPVTCLVLFFAQQNAVDKQMPLPACPSQNHFIWLWLRTYFGGDLLISFKISVHF
jgi:hypothetical protein